MDNKLDTIDPKHLDQTTGGERQSDPITDTLKRLGENLPFPRKGGPKRPCIVCGLG